MDSRTYLFLFSVNTPGDIPDDFGVSIQKRSFETGIFLPQEDTGWFTQPPRYPAHLLLLQERCLYIIPHPSAGKPSIELSLDDLVQIETGTSLLRGWIQFRTQFASFDLNYNTRTSRPLDYFVSAVRRRWLGETFDTPQPARRPARMFGQKLDIKFRNMLRDTLDRNEVVLSQYFVPALEHRHKVLLFRRVVWHAGHVVALTSGNRFIWLKDECRGRRERYAGISVSAPSLLLRSTELQRSDDHEELVLKFTGDLSWRISVYTSDPDCAGFVHLLNSHIAAKSPERHNLAMI